MRTDYVLLLAAALAVGTAEGQTCSDRVRPTTPTERFKFLHGGETVLAPGTGLEWKRCAEGASFSDNGTPSDFTDDRCILPETWGSDGCWSFTWQQALQRVEAVDTPLGQTTSNGLLGEGGYSGASDWRVPNIKELMSTVEVACSNPALNTVIFPQDYAAAYADYWTASPHRGWPSDPKATWIVRFFWGFNAASAPETQYRLRLVRGGQ